jgi:hypothetical protein
MENYKILPQRQNDAILDYLIRVYAQETINTNLLIDLLTEKTGADRDQLSSEVIRDLEHSNQKIRDSIFVQYGYLDLTDLESE